MRKERSRDQSAARRAARRAAAGRFSAGSVDDEHPLQAAPVVASRVVHPVVVVEEERRRLGRRRRRSAGSRRSARRRAARGSVVGCPSSLGRVVVAVQVDGHRRRRLAGGRLTNVTHVSVPAGRVMVGPGQRPARRSTSRVRGPRGSIAYPGLAHPDRDLGRRAPPCGTTSGCSKSGSSRIDRAVRRPRRPGCRACGGGACRRSRSSPSASSAVRGHGHRRPGRDPYVEERAYRRRRRPREVTVWSIVSRLTTLTVPPPVRLTTCGENCADAPARMTTVAEAAELLTCAPAGVTGVGVTTYRTSAAAQSTATVRHAVRHPRLPHTQPSVRHQVPGRHPHCSGGPDSPHWCLRNQTVARGGTTMSAYAGWPGARPSTAVTAPRLPTPEPV